MNLSDILSQAQGGGVASLGKQFGLSPQQTQSAVEALLPAFSKGFQQTASSPQGLGALLTMLGGKQEVEGASGGNAVLNEIFGSKDLSRAVASQASQASGVGADVLRKMLPAIAGMLVNGMASQTNKEIKTGKFSASNPLGEIIEQMMKGQGGGRGAPQSNNPLGDILGQILGGGGQGQQRAPQGSDNPLGDILGQILKGGGQQGQPQQRAPQGGGNPLDDILGQILKGGGQGAPQRSPQGGNNPLGDILEQILRQGGGGQAQYEDEEPAARPQQRRAPQRQQPQGQNPLEDILGKMFNPGGQGSGSAQSEGYRKEIGDIFDQFSRGGSR